VKSLPTQHSELSLTEHKLYTWNSTFKYLTSNNIAAVIPWRQTNVS